jgi:hypothetical protein
MWVYVSVELRAKRIGEEGEIPQQAAQLPFIVHFHHGIAGDSTSEAA